MEAFEQRLMDALKSKPGITKQRLASAMDIEYSEEFRERLSQACDRGLVHRVQDKYYPGSLKSY